MTTTSEPSAPGTINPNKALWEKGDFTRIAETMRDSGEALVASLGIEEDLRILDLGSGDGTTAVPAYVIRGGASSSIAWTCVGDVGGGNCVAGV